MYLPWRYLGVSSMILHGAKHLGHPYLNILTKKRFCYFHAALSSWEDNLSNMYKLLLQPRWPYWQEKICLTPISGYCTDTQFTWPFGPQMDLRIDHASFCRCLWFHKLLSENSCVTHTTPSSNDSLSQRSQCILLRIITNSYSGEKIFKHLFRAECFIVLVCLELLQ